MTDHLHESGCVLRRGDPRGCGRRPRFNVGDKLGRLTVVAFSHITRRHERAFLCRCDCGTEKVIASGHLTKASKPTRSCGCLIADTTRHRYGDPFEGYVPEPNTGCWLWARHINSKGYGLMHTRGTRRRTRLAHREFWRRHRGEIPSGLYVLHACDTPACVNPGHLFLGTQRDNVLDMISKGRGQFQRAKRARLAARKAA